MKKLLLITLAGVLVFPALSAADDFLGAPLAPDAEVATRTKSRLELKVPASHDQIVAFYQEALKDQADIKFRHWKDATYIEDDGNRKWHSITISKDAGTPTPVVIMKDNWTWIIGTLVLRFIGVFVVLLVLYAGMSFSGGLISRSVRRAQARQAAQAGK